MTTPIYAAAGSVILFNQAVSTAELPLPAAIIICCILLYAAYIIIMD